MAKPIWKHELKQQLAKGEIESVSAVLREIAARPEYQYLQNEVILQAARLEDFSKEKRAGVLYAPEQEVKRMRLYQAFLEIVEQLPDEIEEGRLVRLRGDKKKLIPRREVLRWGLMSLLVMIIAGLAWQLWEMEGRQKQDQQSPIGTEPQQPQMNRKDSGTIIPGKETRSPSIQPRERPAAQLEQGRVFYPVLPLHGLVKDEATGRGLEGVKISSSDGQTTVTDANGAYTFSFSDTPENQSKGIELSLFKEGYKAKSEYCHLSQEFCTITLTRHENN